MIIPQPHQGDLTSSRRAALVVALAALLVLTEQVLTGGPLTDIDVDIAMWLRGQGPRHPFILAMAEVISRIATPQWSVAGSLVLAGGMSRCARSWQPLKRTTAAVGLLSATVLGMKMLIDRPGPRGSGATGYFPSGHTATAVVCGGTLLLLAHGLWPGLRRFHLRRLVVLWALLVGWAMTWHNYHWLTDVIAAWLLGGLLLVALSSWRSPVKGPGVPGQPRHAPRQLGVQLVPVPVAGPSLANGHARLDATIPNAPT